MFEITSENIFVSDGESGATDPPSYDKSGKKIKMAILDTGGNLKFTVRSFWEQILIQPIFEQIVSKVDFYNSKSTTEMCRVIQPLEVGEFQCNVLLAVDYDIKGGTLLPLRLSCNKSVTDSTDVTVILIPLRYMANLILEQTAVITDGVETNDSYVEKDYVIEGSILTGGEECQWKSKASLGYDIKGGTQSWILYFSSHLSSQVHNVSSSNQCEVFNGFNNHENHLSKNTAMNSWKYIV